MRSGNHQNVPKFGRQFLSRYSLSGFILEFFNKVLNYTFLMQFLFTKSPFKPES